MLTWAAAWMVVRSTQIVFDRRVGDEDVKVTGQWLPMILGIIGDVAIVWLIVSSIRGQ